jgi:hypothetical protein
MEKDIYVVLELLGRVQRYSEHIQKHLCNAWAMIDHKALVVSVGLHQSAYAACCETKISISAKVY